MKYRPGETIKFNSGNAALVDEVKEGGMAVVYLCEHYAYKTLKEDLFRKNPDLLDAFERECRIWISLGSHPFIVSAEAIEKNGDTVFVKMKRSNENLLDSMGKVYPRFHLMAGLRMVLEICIAMAYASSRIKNFVHRDLKPSNVLMRFNSFHYLGHEFEEAQLRKLPIFWPRQSACVADFGLAKIALGAKQNIGGQDGSEIGDGSMFMSRMGQIAGTPPYMSPEQCIGGPLDQRSDIYAVGCIMYQVFSGKLLFPAKTAQDFISHHVRTNPVALSTVVPNMPVVLNNIVMKCLEKRPEKRFGNFSEIIEAVFPLLRLEGEVADYYSNVIAGKLSALPMVDRRSSTEISRLPEMALKFIQLGKEEEASALVSQIEKLCGGKNGPYFYELAKYAEVPGRIEKNVAAIKRFRELFLENRDQLTLHKLAVEITPDFTEPYLWIFFRYRDLEDWEACRRILEQWLEYEPDNPRALKYLNDSTEDGSRKLEILTKLERVSPDVCEPQLLLGDYCLRAGGVTEALEHFEKGAGCSADHWQKRACARHLVEIYRNQGDRQNLLQEQRRHLDLIADYWTEGEQEGAYREFEKLLEMTASKNSRELPYWIYGEMWRPHAGHFIDVLHKRPRGVKSLEFFRVNTAIARYLESMGYPNAAIKICTTTLQIYRDAKSPKLNTDTNDTFVKMRPPIIYILERYITQLRKNPIRPSRTDWSYEHA
jgi:serine/threonine protein kinase